jgi:2-dehydro-3-deoxygluconokinase
MIEERADAAFAWGGDVVNTAVYLARQGAEPHLMTAMGADAGSDAIVAAWAAEGIGVDHVLRDPSRTAGRYKIALGAEGQRTFSYDRDRSAARGFFSHPRAAQSLRWAGAADVLYLTGITLSIFGRDGREQIGALARKVRARGGQVVFDTNYRPLGWSSAAAAWDAMAALAPAITLAMPSVEDHAGLVGPASAAEVAAAWLALGADEVVVKQGPDDVHLASRTETVIVPAATPARIIDTTAAGDSFNAGYIAARLVEGLSMRQAAERGGALAAAVIGWPGAIAPRPVGERSVNERSADERSADAET